MTEFRCKVDETGKATEMPIWRICGTVKQNPHMRCFWGGTCSFFVSFIGWFALAPFGLYIAKSINICENQVWSLAVTVWAVFFVGLMVGVLLSLSSVY